MPRQPRSRCTRCRRLHDGTGRCPNCRPNPNRSTTKATRTAAAWHWVYNDPRWHALRDQVLSEEPLCRVPRCDRPSTIVDHITPHRGDVTLAFDRTNLQGMCKPHHDAKTAREVGLTYTTPRITVVCGPPCAGKTTYVHDHATLGDLILDWDALAQALGSPVPHGHDPALRPVIAAARDAILDRLTRGHDLRHAWHTTTQLPHRIHVPAVRIIVLDTPPQECKARARRDGRPAVWDDLIDRWWSGYRPALGVGASTSPRSSG